MLIASSRVLAAINAPLLAVGRGLGAAAMALMVVIILAQVWFRYVIGNALPWPDEASRFLMLWLAGLMAPTAFRRGGFVSIDMFAALLPRRVGAILSLILLVLTLMVLVVAFRIGWSEVTGFGGRFATSSLSYPTSLDLSTWTKVPRAWMMMSLHVGVTLLLLVNVELILRSLAELFGVGDRLPVIAGNVALGAE